MNNKPKNITLSELPKHNIYQVPENYFDKLPMRVMERTATAPQQDWLPAQLWQNLRVAIAPVVMLLLFVGVLYVNIAPKPEQQAAEFATLHNTEIMDYLTSYATIESNDFAEMTTLREKELTADVLNVSSAAAEEELEYYHLRDTDY